MSVEVLTSRDVSVLFDGDRLVVVDKPPGLTSEDTAAQLGLKLCHRLDRLTSGALVLARDARTVQRWHRMLSTSSLRRCYRFVCEGSLEGEQTITSYLVRDRGDGKRGSTTAGQGTPAFLGAQEATTFVRSLDVDVDGHRTFGEAVLHTGRTHQIRIHLAELGHPLVGDPVYGHGSSSREAVDTAVAVSVAVAVAVAGAADDAERMWLHAWRLEGVHPNTRAPFTVEAPLPRGFAKATD